MSRNFNEAKIKIFVLCPILIMLLFYFNKWIHSYFDVDRLAQLSIRKFRGPISKIDSARDGAIITVINLASHVQHYTKSNVYDMEVNFLTRSRHRWSPIRKVTNNLFFWFFTRLSLCRTSFSSWRTYFQKSHFYPPLGSSRP